ncbi:hypothetical protein [Massilia sp. Leaf139]|uniref:hypothetical protein n=1 Tax=Massilia sp. Leaf139 TaxID=1736272 RepID=UPI0006F3ED08|nr:hypothetical protein [Massilia sp. Leaf139]KQQ96881.1 hypothetical protein ASF77_02545 [Massilia sp. Leaf139]
MIKPSLFAALMAVSILAPAQNLSAPRALAPIQAAPGVSDPMDTGVMAAPSDAGSLRTWYAAQRRPGVVLYFERKLAQLPPGWRGASRLHIEDKRLVDGKESKRNVTVGVEHNVASEAPTSQFAALFQQSLQQEMKRQQLTVLDGSVLQRKHAGSGKGGDVEYASLNAAARFVFEVELLNLNGNWEMVGALKDIRSGALVATVNLPFDAIDSRSAMDRASRSLIARLLQANVG